MTSIVDTRGHQSPLCLIQKALDTDDEGDLQIIVGNLDTMDKVCDLARNCSCRADVTMDSDDYYITITREEPGCTGSPRGSMVILFESDSMGPDVELGRILIRNYIHTIVHSEHLPHAMIFLNRGVFLTSEGSDVLDDLSWLDERGTEILSCGTCLDYFHLKDDLKVGQATNMYTISETLAQADKTLTV